MTLSNEYPLAVFPASVVLPTGLSAKEQCAANPPAEVSSIASESTMQSKASVETSPYFAMKPTIDWMLTAVLLVFALPLLGVVSLAVLLLDGRPVFYRQTRVGKDGHKFRIWKFRTMVPNAETATGAVWSSIGDPRVTRLGHWLRCSHLDELPQLLNVLCGDMNLIGPRPERPEFVRELAAELPSYLERLRVRPGITGLAQLRLGYDQSVDQVRKKVQLDITYIQTASLYGDSKLALGTIPYVVNNLRENLKGAVPYRIATRDTAERSASASVAAEPSPSAPRIYMPDSPHDILRPPKHLGEESRQVTAMAFKRV